MSWLGLIFPDDVYLSYVLGNSSSIGRVDARVFAAGWDGRYLVAKQHPKGDKSVTNYFIIDSQKDSPSADAKQVVTGPFRGSRVWFSRRRRRTVFDICKTGRSPNDGRPGHPAGGGIRLEPGPLNVLGFGALVAIDDFEVDQLSFLQCLEAGPFNA